LIENEVYGLVDSGVHALVDHDYNDVLKYTGITTIQQGTEYTGITTIQRGTEYAGRTTTQRDTEYT
jgi:hypothetical protein